jgi:hypothetical protein
MPVHPCLARHQHCWFLFSLGVALPSPYYIENCWMLRRLLGKAAVAGYDQVNDQ